MRAFRIRARFSTRLPTMGRRPASSSAVGRSGRSTSTCAGSAASCTRIPRSRRPGSPPACSVSRARRGVARQQARKPRGRARAGPSRAGGLVYAGGVRAQGRHAPRRLRRARRHRGAVRMIAERSMLRATPSVLVALALLACGMPAARAADYPTRPVTLVVAFTPGGASDVLARILGHKFEQILGQPFVIDNRPGAGGNVAAEAVAHAAPDGYTLFNGNNAILATNAALYKKINFDPEADFAPIGLIGSQANIQVV